MFSQYFGNYLLNKGLITPEQLKEGLSLEKSLKVKLGILAMSYGFMTGGQVAHVHSQQAKLDKKFGEIAVQLGYLTDRQLEELLASQKYGHLLLGQALVDTGCLSLPDLQMALEEYKKNYSLGDEELLSLQRGEVEQFVTTFLKIEHTVYKNYITLLIKNIIRFIDSSPQVDSYSVQECYHARWLTFQKIKGEINLYTALAADTEVFLQMAGKFAGENFNELTELARASLGEFLNLHNGIFLVNMSDQGLELEMKPQMFCGDHKITGLEKGYIVPIRLSFGKLDLILIMD
ncbi:MAG: hypothetical protein ACOWWO_02225 [Peptococcaceae bacterium]